MLETTGAGGQVTVALGLKFRLKIFLDRGLPPIHRAGLKHTNLFRKTCFRIIQTAAKFCYRYAIY